MQNMNGNNNVVDTNKMSAIELYKHYEKLCYMYDNIQFCYEKIYSHGQDVEYRHFAYEFSEKVDEIFNTESKDVKCHIDNLCNYTRDEINKIVLSYRMLELCGFENIHALISYLIECDYDYVIHDIYDDLYRVARKNTISSHLLDYNKICCINRIVNCFIFFNLNHNDKIYKYLEIFANDCKKSGSLVKYIGMIVIDLKYELL